MSTTSPAIEGLDPAQVLYRHRLEAVDVGAVAQLAIDVQAPGPGGGISGVCAETTFHLRHGGLHGEYGGQQPEDHQ